MVHAPPSKGWKGFVKNVIAGGAAGTIEVLCMYPLDVVKTRMQLSSGPASAGVPKTVFGTLRHIAATEGVANLYRGIISPILAEAPKRACKFASNEQYKKLFAKSNGDTNGFRLYLAGASAGATEAFVNTPFEVVKVRMQAKENLARYKGTSHALTTIVKEEGLLALYKGFETQLVRNALWNGAYFSLIQKFKDFAGPRENPTEQSIVGFLCGAAAGIVGTTCNTPFDVVKSRMQNQITLPGQLPKYRYSFQGVAVVFREEGLRACYKGYMPRIYRLGPGGGIMLVAFDFINSLLTF